MPLKVVLISYDFKYPINPLILDTYFEYIFVVVMLVHPYT